MPESVNQTTPPPVYQFTQPFGFNIVSIPGVPTPIAFRPNFREDQIVIQSILIGGEYRFPIENFQPKLILDCGGNIGCASIYFANQYPDAQIYSVEPAENNFKLLKFNTSFYDNVHAIKSALWDKETYICVKNGEHNNLGWMAFEASAENPDSMKTVTVSKILNESGFDIIDLLKIDIEGAEKEVFGAENVHEWLSRVNVLVIELHDRMKRGCSYEFFKAISKYKWFFAFRGENLIFIREDRIAEKVLNSYDF